VEITESVLIQDTERVCGVLIKLRDLGVTISLDDFGTGYSSLSYLHRFPLDRVKIDRSFLRKACSDQNSLTLLHGIIRLGVELGLGLVIEGLKRKINFTLCEANVRCRGARLPVQSGCSSKRGCRSGCPDVRSSGGLTGRVKFTEVYSRNSLV